MNTLNIVNILEKLDFINENVYAVGGCVRDLILGKTINDIDITSSTTPQEVIKLCNKHDIKVIPTGLDHGTVTILVNGQHVEHTTYRVDIDTDGRHADVLFGESPKEDSRRRDFTINALYVNKNLEIVDFHNGLYDIKNKQLNSIGDTVKRYEEDYLRIVRAIRFKNAYDLCIDSNHQQIMVRMSNKIIENVSKERILDEIEKIICKYNSDVCWNFIRAINRPGSLEYCIFKNIFKDYNGINVWHLRNVDITYKVFLYFLFCNMNHDEWPLPREIKEVHNLIEKINSESNTRLVIWNNKNKLKKYLLNSEFSTLFSSDLRLEFINYITLSKTLLKNFPDTLEGPEIGKWQKDTFLNYKFKNNISNLG